jgi:hypothetical protein
MEKFDEPMFYDRLVSLDFGPVTSHTLNLINGMVSDDVWSRYMGPRDNVFVAASSQPSDDSDLDHLSKAERRVLANVWSEFADMDRFDLAEWTHKHIPEWEDPRGSMKPISHEIVFKFLGKTNASDLEDEVHRHRRLKQALGAEA